MGASEEEDDQNDPCQRQYQQPVDRYAGTANLKHDEDDARGEQREKQEKRRMRHGRHGRRSACRNSERGLVTEASGR